MNNISISTLCEHDWCNLYASAHMLCGIIIDRADFCPVCKIFNHAAKYTHHIERALKTTPRLRLSLVRWTFIPDLHTAIVPIAVILQTLHHHSAQNIRPLLKNLFFNIIISIRHNVPTEILITTTHNLPCLRVTPRGSHPSHFLQLSLSCQSASDKTTAIR